MSAPDNASFCMSLSYKDVNIGLGLPGILRKALQHHIRISLVIALKQHPQYRRHAIYNCDPRGISSVSTRLQ